MFEIVKLFYGTQGGGKGKENDRESTTLKYIISVLVEAITLCIGSC
jgi:hypothetical protein